MGLKRMKGEDDKIKKKSLTVLFEKGRKGPDIPDLGVPSLGPTIGRICNENGKSLDVVHAICQVPQ